MSDELVRILVSVFFGALAGGVTNTVAIWMLFHPYQPPRIGPWRLGWLQGAVPKNQARLASAIGRTVGDKLLTEEDLARTFARPEFRDAFDQRLTSFLDRVLLEERGTVRELLPTAVAPQAEAFLQDVVTLGLDRLETWVRSQRFADEVARRREEIVRAVADQPIGGLLTPVREEAITQAVEEWLENAVESEGFGRAIDDYLQRGAERLLKPERTFEEILPLGLVGSMERAIQSYLPLAIERLGALLEDPETRARFESTLHDLFHRFLRDLKFHQRVVARLVVTEDTLDKVLDTIEKEGAERLSELLQDPAVQDAMARGVNEAIVDFLRRPVREVLGPPDSPDVREALATAGEWVRNLARDPATRAFVVEKLEAALQKASARTWGEILERLPTETVADGLLRIARSDAARTFVEDLAEGLPDLVLDRRIGTPASWLPAGAPERIERALSDPLWEWLQGQVPEVVERLDVARRVEEKVLDFPMPRLEELVRRVTDRELRLIVQLGYVLGAFIGLLLVGVNALLG